MLKTCECSCHLEIHFLSSRSAQALIDSCLFLVSLKKHSSRYFFISGIAGRHISSRFSKANAKVRTVLVDTCYPISESSSTSFHLSQQNNRTKCAVASPCSGVLKPSLCQRHCAVKSSNESGSLVQTLPPMQTPLGIFQMSVHLTVQAMLRGCKHMTRFRGSRIRETHGTDVTSTRCPASQHTQ